ncbi:cytidylyltransferase domain-containing protein [Bacillus paranthracis]|uniref:acylneuraminate cytidylyltransferase family protein n=1 Tax=Bacillus paranthracis TaxID=2026186 RepID=UPI00398CD241
MGTLGIIPARGGSKGLPLKNIKNLNNIPMIAYTIKAALDSKIIDRIVVSTDDPNIAEISKKYGAEVPFLRPDHLATDTATTIDVVSHCIDYYEGEIDFHVNNIILLQPTSPLRTSKDIQKAFKVFLENEADSLQSVCRADSHPYLLRKIEDGILSPYFNFDNKNLRRQDLKEVYQLNGAIYIAKKEVLKKYVSFIGEKNCAYIMSKESSIDIDDIYDFKMVEMLMQEYN